MLDNYLWTLQFRIVIEIDEKKDDFIEIEIEVEILV